VGCCLAAIISLQLPSALPTAVLTHNKRQKTTEEEDPDDKHGNNEDKDENENDKADEYFKKD
jgi:hypothetical protein